MSPDEFVERFVARQELESQKCEKQAHDKQDNKMLTAEKKKPHGLRYNDGKLKWSYVNFEALEPMVRVLMFGAQKYEPFNWQKGLDRQEILESMQRHLAALFDGETNDKESGISHMGHIMCNAMFYNYFNKINND